MCVIGLAFLGEQIGQLEMKPKERISSVEKGCGSKGGLEIVNGLLLLALGMVYIAKTMGLASQGFLAGLVEIDRGGLGREPEARSTRTAQVTRRAT